MLIPFTLSMQAFPPLPGVPCRDTVSTSVRTDQTMTDEVTQILDRKIQELEDLQLARDLQDQLKMEPSQANVASCSSTPVPPPSSGELLPQPWIVVRKGVPYSLEEFPVRRKSRNKFDSLSSSP